MTANLPNPPALGLWGSLPVAALLLDRDNRIRNVNPLAEELLILSAKSLQGQCFWTAILGNDRLGPALERAREDRTDITVSDLSLAGLARDIGKCDVHFAPLEPSEGQMICVLIPKQRPGQLGRAQPAYSAAKTAIGMAEMLAHEIKNPLAGIMGAAQLVRMNLSPQDAELTDLIVDESQRIVTLLDRVEQFGDVRLPQMGAVNLHDVLNRAQRSAEVGFGRKMRFVQDFDPSLPLALGDLDQLLQVVLNLLKNASEAAGADGGTIQLRSFYEHALKLRSNEGENVDLPLQIEICDDGPGLPEEIKDCVFDPFVSGHENGTGLGLALVSKIMSDHAAWISVTSKPGATVFRLSFARAPQQKLKKEG